MAERESLDIVQYLPCAARPDGAEAKEIAKVAVGAILVALWPTGNDWPAQRETIVRMSGIARPEMVGALDRLRRGERAGRVLDDRFDIQTRPADDAWHRRRCPGPVDRVPDRRPSTPANPSGLLNELAS